MGQPNHVTDDQTVTVRVPITIRQRGGRKLVLAPDGRAVVVVSVCRRIDSAMIKAIARAFRWRDMLENGTYCTIREIAAAEKIDETYIGRVLRLTLLAPDIVEAILDGRQPEGLGLATLLKPFPLEWDQQRYRWAITGARNGSRWTVIQRADNAQVGCVASGLSRFGTAI